MEKIDIKDLTAMAVSVALMLVLGGLLYFGAGLLAIPGGRFLAMTPLFSLIYTNLILRVKKIGLISLTSLAFGAFLLKFSIFGVLAILVSAFVTDILSLIFIGKYESFKDIYLSLPINFAMWVISSYYVVNIFIPDSNFEQAAFWPTIFIALIMYLVGMFSSKIAISYQMKRGLVDKGYWKAN